MKDHQLIDERSLILARLIAGKVAQDPTLIIRAAGNIDRWLLTCSPAARSVFQEWQHLLDGPLDALLQVLDDPEEHATRLRQSNPFAGVLSPEERSAVFQEFERRESSAA